MPVGSSPLDRLRQRFEEARLRVEKLISGSAPDDPLYLTNRTWQQKAKTAAMIGVPVLVLGALVTIGITDLFGIHAVDPFERPAAETAAPLIPPQKKLPEPKFVTTDLEVVNIRIAKDAHPPVVTGLVRNNTNQKVDSAEVSYYLADNSGSLVGTETADVQNVAAHGSVPFRVALKSAKAEYVIVREIHLN